jgi:hypothetical protein
MAGTPFSLVFLCAGSTWSQHAEMWPDSTATFGGACRLQISIANGQRG